MLGLSFLHFYIPPIHAQESPPKSISYKPSLISQISIIYEDHSFKIQLYSYFIRVKPFVIFQGEYYGLQQILNYLQSYYPHVSYSSILQKFKQAIHFGFNLTQLPQNVADGLEYIGFRLVDLNFPLSWFKLGHRKNGFPVIMFTKANLILSFEDLYPYGYSVMAVNSSYILVGGVKGKTDLFMDPIVRSGDTMSITGGTEEAEIEDVYWEFWNASYVNGWNLAFRNEFGVQFAFNGTLEIGDWETETWVADEEKQILFFGDNDPLYVADYGHFRNGRLIDEENKITSGGCSLFFNFSAYRGMWSDYQSSALFYDTDFYQLESTLEIYLEGNSTFWGCEFYGLDALCTTEAGSSSWYDVKLVECLEWFSEEATPELKDITILNSTENHVYFYLLDNMTVANLYVRNSEDVSFQVKGTPGHLAENVYLINPNVDVWSFNFASGYLGEVYHQVSYDLQVLYQNGSNVNGASVEISSYGQGLTQEYSGSTASNGTISTRILSIEFFNRTGGDTPYSFNPFCLNIIKGSYGYFGNFTISGEEADTIILQEPEPEEEPPSQGPYFSAQRVDYGSFSLGIMAPKEIHPGFFDYVSNRVPIHIDLRVENYQIRARDFQLSYELRKVGGDLVLSGSEFLEVGAGEYETVSLSIVEPFSKTADSRNYTLTVTVEVGRKYSPIDWPIRISHEPWAPLIYTSAFLTAVVGLLSLGYGLYHYWPRIKGEAKKYYG